MKKMEKNSAQKAGVFIAWPREKLAAAVEVFAGRFRLFMYASSGREMKMQPSMPSTAKTPAMMRNTGVKFTMPEALRN